ncbi:MAG: DUF799 family lipoprotein, partial [Nitrospirae bacterium]|nr:DUF799 family lipoprotein [Nitrospirota bacterium]
ATLPAPPPEEIQPAVPPARLTAVLPFANETNTVDAPEILRTFMAEELVRHGFTLQPLNETGMRLWDRLQISDGGQLPAADPKQIGDALEAGALFYGDILEWKKVTTGIYNVVSIKAHFKLVDAASGAVRWELTHEVRKRINMNTGNNIVADILAGAIVNLFLNPMTPYAHQLAREVGRQLPGAPGGIPPAAIFPREIPPGEIPQGEIQ